jgi:hypothetical protein
MNRLIFFLIATALNFAVILVARGIYNGYEPLADTLVAEASLRRVLIFGDSVTYTSAECDADKRTIPEMLDANIGETTAKITHGAYSPFINRHLVDLLDAPNRKIDTVIIPLNLASFYSRWTDRIGFRFFLNGAYLDFRTSRSIDVRSIVMDHLVDNGWFPEPRFPITSRGEVLPAMTYIGRSLDCGAPPPTEQERIQLKTLFRSTYDAPPIYPEDIEESLRSTVRKLSKLKIRTLVYLTPIDLEGARGFVGPDLVHQIDAKASRALSIASEEGAEILDLHAALSSEHFMDKRYVCEHLYASGRQFVAQQVAAKLRDEGP